MWVVGKLEYVVMISGESSKIKVCKDTQAITLKREWP